MKTILWAALAANGNYAHNNPEHPPKREALEDFAGHVRQTGNFIVGRRTFEAFNAGAGPNNPFADIDIVVVSKSELPSGITRASSPREAIDYLKGKGHEAALLAGGESLHNAFLAENLIDELVFNVTPVLEGKGHNLLLPEGQYKDVRLVESKDIGGGIVQLRYAVDRQ